MSSLARFKLSTGRMLVACVAVATVAIAGQNAAQAQSLTINFRFDGQVGPAATTQTIAAGSAGQTYTVDAWATITGPAGTLGSNAGLVTLRFRGLSSTSANSAFSAGAGIGVTSFTMLSPFNATANIPTIGDVGSASAYSTTSATLDGISDFGGAAATSSAVANSNSGTTPELGGNASPSSEPVANGWEFLVGQFKYTTGTAKSTVGATTSFLPVTGLGASSSKSSFTVDGGTTFIHGDWTSGSAINFQVVPGVVLGALADNSNTAGTFGPPQAFVVPGSGPYNTVDSSVIGLVPGTTGGSTAFPPSGVGGRARILAGINSSTNPKNVTMGWRTRLVPSEISGNHPPLPDSTTTGLISDVVDVQGLGNPSDPFVLDMTYNPAMLPKGSTTNGHTTPSTLEAGLANNKLIYMVSPLSGVDGTQYVNTVAVNTGNIVVSPLDPRYGYVGSFAQFLADPAGANGDTNLAHYLGAWGVDTALHEVWADVNHNSTFAVVPEPSTILLAGLGLLGLFGLRRRVAKVA